MTDKHKADRVDSALHRLAAEIAADNSISLSDALVAMNALMAFTRDVPLSSKVRLFDILTSKLEEA